MVDLAYKCPKCGSLDYSVSAVTTVQVVGGDAQPTLAAADYEFDKYSDATCSNCDFSAQLMRFDWHVVPPDDWEVDLLVAYRALHDGLSDMIESGRLTEADCPDDYAWLVDRLAGCGALDFVEELEG